MARHGLQLGLALIGSALVAACSSAGATPTPVASLVLSASATPTPLATKPPETTIAPTPSAAATLAPSGSPGVSPAATDPDIPVGPDRTLPPGTVTWPPSVVNATIALAAADNEFKKATADWTTAAETQDMDLLLTAAEGMADLARESLPNAQRMTTWADTSEVGAQLIDVYTAISASGTAVGAALRAGDTYAFEAGVVGLKGAMEAYGIARVGLVDRTELALIMRRGLLVK